MSRRNLALAVLALFVTAALVSGLLLGDPAIIGLNPGERPPAFPPGERPLLTEFGDFQCPHCANFAVRVTPLIRRELVETGQARFEYRHYPFIGPDSMKAAMASECARDQDAFDEYHDALYLAEYRANAAGRNLPGITPGELLDAALESELDPDDFTQCLESGRTGPRVMADREYGYALGVRGTPSLYLDGRPLGWESPRDLVEKVRRAGSPGDGDGPPPAAITPEERRQ